eukprot:737493_1
MAFLNRETCILQDEISFEFLKSCCRSRITDLQEHLQNSSCYVFIPGIDGNFNGGSHAAIRFLLEGASGVSLQRGGSVKDVDLEDVVLAVYRDAIGIFCNVAAKQKILELTSMCQNVKLFCQSDDIDADDTDAAELFKIRAFQEMVDACVEVRVPVAGETGARSAVEKWPLVQAYALEELGSRGFFTMRHKVVDCTETLNSIMTRVDAQSLQNVLLHSVSKFQGTWESLISALDCKSAEKRSKLTESQVIEPLESYFTYAKLGLPD